MKFFTQPRHPQMPLLFLLLLLAAAPICVAQQATPPQTPTMEPWKANNKIVLENHIRVMRSERENLAHKISQLSEDLNQTAVKRQKLILRHSVSPESIVEMTRMLQTQRVQLEIDLAGLDARREFLQKANREMNNEHSNEVLAPLQEVLVLAKTRLGELKEGLETRRNGIEEVREAESRVLKAEIGLAQAKRSNTQLSGLSAELLDASLERAEKMARREAVQKMLDSITDARTDVETVKRIDAEVESLNESLANYRKKARDLDINVAWHQQELKALEVQRTTEPKE